MIQQRDAVGLWSVVNDIVRDGHTVAAILRDEYRNTAEFLPGMFLYAHGGTTGTPAYVISRYPVENPMWHQSGEVLPTWAVYFDFYNVDEYDNTGRGPECIMTNLHISGDVDQFKHDWTICLLYAHRWAHIRDRRRPSY